MTELRPFYMSDLAKVTKLIHATDEDDALAAENDYHQTGLEDQYVFEQDGKIIGVTGFRKRAGCDQTYWLSWTYLTPEQHGKGLGKNMLSELLIILKQQEARQLYVKISDYCDPDKGPVYDKAMKLYLSVGFKVEVETPDFYDIGEKQSILSLNINIKPALDHAIKAEKLNLQFSGVAEIAETENTYTFNWTVKEKRYFFSRSGFSYDDVLIGIDYVKKQGGRKICLTFPSNLSLIDGPLTAAGFRCIGKLADYYEQGIDELHYMYDLT